jgi:DNA-binding transcriptional regulator of glucitol operon
VSTNRVPRRGAPGGTVLQLVLSPHWILWHLLTLGAMATCGFLAAWQWRRAGSAMGSAVNVGYGLQWPVFALFFAWIWWRMLRIELAKVREAEPVPDLPVETAAPRPSLPSGPSPFVHRHGAVPAVSDDDDPELAEYNRMLAALADRDRQSTN